MLITVDKLRIHGAVGFTGPRRSRGTPALSTICDVLRIAMRHVFQFQQTGRAIF